MCKGSDGMFHIVAVYDICRSDLAKFKGLSRGDDTPHLEGGNGVNYVAINGTDPSGTVDAASTLAVTLFAECDEAASEHVNSLIRIPTCWVEFQGNNGMVEKTMMGKTYNIHWDTNAGGKPIANDNQEEMKSAPTESGPPGFPSNFKVPTESSHLVRDPRSRNGNGGADILKAFGNSENQNLT